MLFLHMVMILITSAVKGHRGGGRSICKDGAYAGTEHRTEHRTEFRTEHMQGRSICRDVAYAGT